MRETRLSGSVEGVVSNHDPYSDWTSFPTVPSRREDVSTPCKATQPRRALPTGTFVVKHLSPSLDWLLARLFHLFGSRWSTAAMISSHLPLASSSGGCRSKPGNRG